MITQRKPPYQDTSVDPAKTKAAIDKLFREYGVSGVIWKENYEKNTVELLFSVETELNGIRRKIGLKVSPPLFFNRHKTYNPKTGRTETINAPNYAQSYRLLFYWLKAKLEAVSYGLSSIEKEFLSQVITTLPNGQQTTIGEIIGEGNFDRLLPSGD